ncbi:MAG: zinc ribbon domain-containing protein [Desulfobacteraceae bacterium]|nr:MAG: zinc ribbon domain-containing protein [Desulfobacteraceae bacterium]
MICPKCKFEQTDGNKECTKCGIIFEKYRDPGGEEPKPKPAPLEEVIKTVEEESLFKSLFFNVELVINPFYFGGRVLIFLIILVWGWKFAYCPVASNCVLESFLHLVNLPFHEAGHVIFRIFGRYMMTLGGSLGQLLMPLVCLAALILTRKDSYGASVCLWWFGINFIDLAPYINDARAGVLPLLGGNTGRNSPYGFHDWEYILNELGYLRYDHLVAGIAHKVGIVVMVIALLWGGYLLFRQYKNLDL